MGISKTKWILPLFVLIWSSGFIVARYGMPHSEPMTFMFLRFFGVICSMLPIIFFTKPVWPSQVQIMHIAVAGLFLQFGYLGGVWSGVKIGMPAGLSSLIVGLQPILTALFASFVAEKVTRIQWFGLVLGFVGVVIVLFSKVHVQGLTPLALFFTASALVSITFGTLYQKRYCAHFDLRTGSLIQFTTSAFLAGIFALCFESRQVEWAPEMVGALLWSILPISIGAMSLLFILIRSGDATKLSSVLYLTPPTTFVLAWILFHEALSAQIILGTMATVLGVWLVNQNSLPKFVLNILKQLK